MQQFDLIVMGAGPASLSAAIYGLRYDLKVLIIGGVPGGLMMESHKIWNWPGDPDIAGWQLSQKMKEHVDKLGGEFLTDEVTAAERVGDLWQVKTAGGQEFSAPAVIYALGTAHRHLGIAAEEKYKGKGVSYCSTCDGMFYKGKVTAVIGSGNSALTSVLLLSEICPQVYLITRGSELKGEVAWIKEIEKRNNIIWLKNTNVLDMAGEEKLSTIILDNDYNGSKEIAVEGVFVEVGLLPKTDLFKQWGGQVDETGYVQVAADMSTNLPAFYAAGDITNGSNRFRQILTAGAEGAIAADSAYNYLQQRKAAQA